MIHYIYRNPAGTLTEINSQVNLDRPSQALQVTTNAEQGSVGTASVSLEDPTGSLDLGGLRLFLIEDDQANWVRTWSGYTAERTFSRDIFRAGSAARVIDVALADLNSVLYRVVLTTSTWNRPAETDVARMQALGTAGYLGDTTFLDTSGPVAMDAADYRGQYVHDIIDDCVQQSGKNWYHLDVGTSGSTVFGTWYGLASLTTFSSTLKISNVLADVDGTTTFAALDTKLVSDPSRVYSGVYMPYDGGAVYRTRPATATAFALGGRDTVAPAVNVKTATKANARADRMLLDISTEEDVITTSFQCGSTYVNDIRAGMLVQCKFSHFTNYTSFTYMRVLNRTVTLLAPPDATGQAWYEVALTLTPQSNTPINACQAAGPTPAGFYPPVSVDGIISGVSATSPANGIVVYSKPGDGYPPGTHVAQPNFPGGWHFPNYGLSSSFSPSGQQDAWGTLASNSTYIAIVGDGHIAIYATDFLSSAVNGQADLYASNGGALSPVSTVNWTTPNTLVEFDLTGGTSGICYHIIYLHDGPGNGGGAIGFGGFTWTPA